MCVDNDFCLHLPRQNRAWSDQISALLCHSSRLAACLSSGDENLHERVKQFEFLWLNHLCIILQPTGLFCMAHHTMSQRSTQLELCFWCERGERSVTVRRKIETPGSTRKVLLLLLVRTRLANSHHNPHQRNRHSNRRKGFRPMLSTPILGKGYQVWLRFPANSCHHDMRHRFVRWNQVTTGPND